MVDWIIVRLLLSLSMVLQLDIQQVDYTNTFCRDPLNQTVFVELPSGYKVLLLQIYVYGLRQSPLNFYKYLRQGL